MSELQRLYICATGLISSIGGDSKMTANAVAAGINAYQDSPFYNGRFSAMKFAPVPAEAFVIPEAPEPRALARQSRYRRMLGLAQIALSEVIESMQAQLGAEFQPLPLFLAGPEPCPSPRASIDGRFISDLNQITDEPLALEQSRLFCEGKSGGLECLALAFRYLEETAAEQVLIGGVDSYIDPYVLACYEQENRVLAEGVMDGFCPSEGASFVWLATEDAVKKHQLQVLAYVTKPGLAEESGHRYSAELYRGEGLAQAISQALANEPGLLIQTVFASLNGESFGAKEHGVSFIRNKQRFSEQLSIEHPIDCFGDIGAALAPSFMTLAALGMNKNRYRGPALIYCSQERQQRAACCINRVSN